MADGEDQRIGLTLDTNLPEKMAEATEETKKLAEQASALEAVMAQLATQDEELIQDTDKVAKSISEEKIQAQEVGAAIREAAAAHEELTFKCDAATQKVYEQIAADKILQADLKETGPLIDDVAGAGSADDEGGGDGKGFAQLARKHSKRSGDRGNCQRQEFGASRADAGKRLWDRWVFPVSGWPSAV